jgi:hypothetical protein
MAPVAALVAAVAFGAWATETEISGHSDAVRRLAAAQPPVIADAVALAGLPDPVRRYLSFAVPRPPEGATTVRLTAAGAFRRPGTTSFQATTAEQTVALGTPALMFAATTPIVPGVWARAYDFFADGRMVMRAKILSLLAVVDERENPTLNQISLRRWLIESPLYPLALLPGGPVTWQPIDSSRARATVAGFGTTASLVARFRPDGSLESLTADEPGDLETPYHGSGEYAERTDYRPVQGLMIPHGFTLARKAGERVEPFWRGTITAIRFE